MADIIVYRNCPNCHGKHGLVVDKEKYERWERKEGHIQDIFPELGADQREFLMTGICSDKCWREFLL